MLALMPFNTISDHNQNISLHVSLFKSPHPHTHTHTQCNALSLELMKSFMKGVCLEQFLEGPFNHAAKDDKQKIKCFTSSSWILCCLFVSVCVCYNLNTCHPTVACWSWRIILITIHNIHPPLPPSTHASRWTVPDVHSHGWSRLQLFWRLD